MKLIRQMIEKKLEIKDFCFLRKYYLRSIYQFYQAFNLSIALLSLDGKLNLDNKYIKLRNKMYKKVLLKSSINEKEFKIINKFMIEDFKIINNAVTYLEEINLKASKSYGTYYQPGLVAIDMDEFPIN